MSAAPPVTIVILSHNRSWSLWQAVGSVREHTRWPHQVLVRDHASDLDHRAHIARLAGPDARVDWQERYWSCNEGRRQALDDVTTPYVVFLDDDERVAPRWLESMMQIMLTRPRCGAVTGRLVQEGRQAHSGARFRMGQWDVAMGRADYVGMCEFCAGGCTLYDAETLRRTEFRPEYNAGYEDWDQTLQITQDLGRTIWACAEAIFFHRHLPDVADYVADRWRMTELMDAAIAIWRRWRIRQGILAVMDSMIQMHVRPQPHQFDAFEEVMRL